MSDDDARDAPPDGEDERRAAIAEAREMGRHYLVGIGCFALIVVAVVAFYLWRMNG